MSKNEQIKIKLSVYDRVVVTGLLPKQANRVDGELILGIKQTIKITDEELDKYKFSYLPNGVHIGKLEEAKKDTQEYSFPKAKFRIIRDSFKRADQQNNLETSQEVHALYDRVIDAE